MARFRAQVTKGIEDVPQTQKNQEPKTKNQDLKSGNQKPENEDSLEAYSKDDLEPVNVAGFKVPYVVREHWKAECRKKRVKLSPLLKAYLVDEFGLPPGFTLDDL